MVATKDRIEPTAIQDRIALDTGIVTGNLEWIAADELQIDHRYQRQLKDSKVKKIAKEFDPDVFSVFTVSRRDDGSLYILDGQHRQAALGEMGWIDQKVPCIVYTDLSLEDEAKIFYAPQATRRPLTPIERFRARVVQRDPAALEMIDVVERFGYTVNTTYSGGTGDPSVLDAIGALEHVTSQYKGDMTAVVLGITRDAWGTDEHHLYGNVIRGIANFCYRFPMYERKRLLVILRNNPPARLDADGGDVYRVLGGNRDGAVARVIHRLYNHHLKASRLPEWQDSYAKGKANV